jgi:hypothetical protein
MGSNVNLLLFAGAKIVWSLIYSCSNVAPSFHLMKILWNGSLLDSHSPTTSTFHFGILMSTTCSAASASISLTEEMIEHARARELNFSYCCIPAVALGDARLACNVYGAYFCCAFDSSLVIAFCHED